MPASDYPAKEGPPGADTEIVILNVSGHDVRLDWMRIADQQTTFTGVLETKRDDDPNQKIVHYQDILWVRVRPRTFGVEIRYTEIDTGVARSGSFVAGLQLERQEFANMPPPLAMALSKTWGITEALARDWLAITPAIKEAGDSQLPGRENGPADAYRHLLWGAELTRRFGPDCRTYHSRDA